MAGNRSACLGIDIGGTNLRLALVDDDQNASFFESFRTQEVFGGEGNPTEKLADLIRSYCDRNLGGSVLKAISIGFPSTINRKHNVVLQTPNIDCIPDDYSVTEELSGLTGVPVFINRDVNNLLLFDMMNLKIEQSSTITGIYFGTGIGNSVVVDGKFMYGRNGVAAELGHVPVYGNRRICTCGNTGCLETVVSGHALQIIQQENFPETQIDRMFTERGKTDIMKQFVEGMAQAVALEINIFDPDYIVLGGGLLLMKDFPVEDFESKIHFFARKPYPEKNFRILYSRPGQGNGTIGAAIYAQKRMKDPAFL